jgi:hypothetical protein
VISRGWQPTVVARATFAGRDAIVTADQSGVLRKMRRASSELHVAQTAVVAGLGGLASIPQREHVVAASRDGQLTFLTESRLDVIGRAGEGRRANATSVHVSPTGDYLAVGYDGGFTEIFDLRISKLPSAVQRPLVSMVPADLGVVSTAITTTPMSQHVRALFGLIKAFLEHRFRFDIELGDLVTLTAGDYDISL